MRKILSITLVVLAIILIACFIYAGVQKQNQERIRQEEARQKQLEYERVTDNNPAIIGSSTPAVIPTDPKAIQKESQAAYDRIMKDNKAIIK